MKSNCLIFFKISLFLTFLLAILVRRVSSVMSLQLPGLSYGTGEPTTVEIDFLDSTDAVVYTLKGEIFVQSLPMRSNNLFVPDKLTGSQKFIRKIRIKAGESGMTLRLFSSTTATVPTLMVLMKAGFIMSNNKAIEIDVMDPEDHPLVDKAEINWYDRNMVEIQRQKGFHIGKLELHVERKENEPLQPIYKFGAMASQPNTNLLMPEALMASVPGVNFLPPNAVFMAPPTSSTPNVFFNVAPPQAQQYPNAPPFMQPAAVA